jgi:hypothetical protein
MKRQSTIIRRKFIKDFLNLLSRTKFSEYGDNVSIIKPCKFIIRDAEYEYDKTMTIFLILFFVVAHCSTG